MDDVTLKALKSTLIAYGIHFLEALTLVVIGLLLANIIKRTTHNVIQRTPLDKTLASFLSNTLYIILIFIILVAALAQIGVHTTSIITIIGAAGLAIGLALQSSLANFAAGIMIVFFKPFKVGDLIQVGTATGNVESLNVFTTTLTTPNNEDIVIPNAKITTDIMTNFTARRKRRLDLTIGIGYKDNIDKAKKVILDALAGESRMLAKPEPFIGVTDLAESSVNLVVRVWVRTNDYFEVRCQLLENIKIALDHAKISIPYPQRDIHLIQ